MGEKINVFSTKTAIDVVQHIFNFQISLFFSQLKNKGLFLHHFFRFGRILLLLGEKNEKIREKISRYLQ